MRIAIIGAGIAGLTLAIGCHRAGMQVKLYEKTKQLQNIGGGVLLWPHGVRYLERLGVLDSLKSYLPKIDSCKIQDMHGNTIKNESYAELYSLLKGEVLPIERSVLQQLLLQQLPHHLLSLNKKIVSIENTSSEARVFFADGTVDIADLVVGADGIHSEVRRFLDPGNKPQHAGYCWWGGILQKENISCLSPHEVLFAISYGKICNVWPLASGDCMWFLPVKSEENLQKQLKNICHDWNDEIVQHIIKAVSDSRYFQLPIYTVQPKPMNMIPRIALVGDAYHAMGPILGQGASLAIEDAFVLIQSLKHYSSNLSEAIQSYENLRYPKVKQIAELEEKSSAMMINDNILEVEQLLQLLPHTNLAELYKDLIPLVNDDIKSYN